MISDLTMKLTLEDSSEGSDLVNPDVVVGNGLVTFGLANKRLAMDSPICSPSSPISSRNCCVTLLLLSEGVEHAGCANLEPGLVFGARKVLGNNSFGMTPVWMWRDPFQPFCIVLQLEF